MELAPGTIVAAIAAAGEEGEHTSRWEVLAPFQVTRLRSTWFARSAAPDFSDHRVLLTVCRYNPRLLGRREYVDNVRRRLMHEAEMLTIAHNALPEPVDLFLIDNDQDAFSFPEADRYRRTEPVLVTEALNGRPLDAWVSISGPFTERRALKVARRIADLLGELHGQRILAYEHRPGTSWSTPTTTTGCGSAAARTTRPWAPAAWSSRGTWSSRCRTSRSPRQRSRSARCRWTCGRTCTRSARCCCSC
jgi:hypothetical protein